MTEIIAINGKHLVFGLTWVTIADPRKERAEIAALLKTAKAKLVVRYCGSEIKYGLIRHSPELEGEPLREPMLSAAMLFSSQVKNAPPTENSLLIQRLNEKKVSVILLLRGAPYLDLVLANAELDEQLAALRNEGHAGLVAYGNLHGSVAEKMTPEMLACADSFQAELHKFQDTARSLRRYAVWLLLLVLLAGYAIWQGLKTAQRQESARKAHYPVLMYETAVQRILATASFNADAAWNTMWSVIRNREIEMAGWSLHSIRCKPTQCEEQWQQGNGSFAALQQRLQPGQTISLQANTVTSVIQIPLNGIKTALTRERLPEKNALWADLLGQQQRMKRINPLLVFTPKPAKVIGPAGAAPNPAGPNAVDSRVPANLLVYAGELTIAAPLGFASEIIRQHLGTIMISEILIDAPGDVRNARIQIKGNYYAKS